VNAYAANKQERAEYLKGMRALLDYLEAHPEVPTPKNEDLQLSTYGTNEEAAETVDEFADLVGVKTRRDGTHYYAELKFGPIRYFAVAIRKSKPRAKAVTAR